MANNDFKSFSQQKKALPPEWEGEVQRFAAAVEGRGEAVVLQEIVSRAESAKRAGTLTNAEIDAFTEQLAPVLDGGKRKKLFKIAEKLKRL